MKSTQVARLLTFVAGFVNQQLLLQNEYLIAENRVLRSHLPARLPLTNSQRMTLAEIGKRLGRKGLSQIASIAKPETILAWYRKLIAQKFDGSKHRNYPGRPRTSREMTELVLRMARENRTWDMTASQGPCGIWAIPFLIRRSATSCAVSVSRLLPNAANK
jgi:hypothetical protein